MTTAAYRFNRVWGQLVALCERGEDACSSPEATYYRDLMADFYADMTDEEYRKAEPDRTLTMNRKDKRSPEPFWRINPPETWYYADLIPVRVVTIEGIRGERSSSVVTHDGTEFPKSEIFPTERAAWRSIRSTLVREREVLRKRIEAIEADLNLVDQMVVSLAMESFPREKT